MLMRLLVHHSRTPLQEMIGVCSILTADASVDPVKYLNRAFEHYSKLRGRQGRMLATRAMMAAAAYQAALGRCAWPPCSLKPAPAAAPALSMNEPGPAPFFKTTSVSVSYRVEWD